MTGLTFLKELILIKQVNQKRVVFATIDSFLDKGLKLQHDVCNGWHNVLTMFMDLSDITILNTDGTDCHCSNIRISKCEAVNLDQKADLNEKSRTL